MALSDAHRLDQGDQPPLSVHDRIVIEHPELLGVSESLGQLIDAWDDLKRVSEPMREVVRLAIESNDPIPDSLHPDVAAIDQFMVDRQWLRPQNRFITGILSAHSCGRSLMTMKCWGNWCVSR